MPFDLGYAYSKFQSPRPGYDGTSLQSVFEKFSSEELCWDYIFPKTLHQNAACPQCGTIGPWRRCGSSKQIRHICGKHLSALSGTVFHKTFIPLRVWLYAMLLFANSAESMEISFLERHLGIARRAAFRLARRIRLHMAAIERLNNPVCTANEIHVRLECLHRVKTPEGRRNLTNVLFVASNNHIDFRVVPQPQSHSVRKQLLQIAPEYQIAHTTCYRTFRLLTKCQKRKANINFNPDYFFESENEIDSIKGFFSYFIWSFNNSQIHVSEDYLWLYLAEYQFKYNRRSRSANTFWDMISLFPILGWSSTAELAKDQRLNECLPQPE